MDLNKAMLIGRLTRDVEFRQTPNGQGVASFGLATNRVFTDQTGQRQERVEYHNIVAWGKLADICQKYLTKGKKIYIEGRLQTRDWEGQDGVKKYRTEIIAENMIMLDRIASDNSTFSREAPLASSAREEKASSETSEKNAQPFPPSDEEEIQIENIPF